MTAIQQLILQCFVIEPEDVGAFKRSQAVARVARWRKAKPEHAKRLRQEAHVRGREKICQRSRVWYQENREYAISRNTRAYRNRVRSDPEFRILVNLRKRIWDAVIRGVGGTKSTPTLALTGCSIPELRDHLEAQFRPGMTWENYGPVWHVDHIRPCASFDLLDPAQQRVCFHYTNLQPLFALENLKKGSQ